MSHASLQQTLRADFITSFKHSQGEEDLQADLLEKVVMQYRYAGNVVIPTLFESEPTWLHAKTIPGRHIPTKSSTKATFMAMAAVMRDAVNQEYAYTPLTGVPLYEKKRELNTRIVSNIITRDEVYQDKQRGMGSDPHASYFRNFVLLGESTHCTSFDGLYGDIRAMFADLPISIPDNLIARWELHHPGQQFDPGNFLVLE